MQNQHKQPNLVGPHVLSDNVVWTARTRNIPELGGQPMVEVTAELPVEFTVLRFSMQLEAGALADPQAETQRRLEVLQDNLSQQLQRLHALNIFSLTQTDEHRNWSARLVEYDLRFRLVVYELSLPVPGGGFSATVRLKMPPSEDPTAVAASLRQSLSEHAIFYSTRFAVCHFPEPFQLSGGQAWTSRFVGRHKDQLVVDVFINFPGGQILTLRESLADLGTDSWEGERTRIGEELERRVLAVLQNLPDEPTPGSMPCALPEGGHWTARCTASGLTYLLLLQQELPDGSTFTLSFPPPLRLQAHDMEYEVSLTLPKDRTLKVYLWLPHPAPHLSAAPLRDSVPAWALQPLRSRIESCVPWLTTLDFAEANALPDGFSWQATLQHMSSFAELSRFTYDVWFTRSRDHALVFKTTVCVEEPYLAEAALLRERLRLSLTLLLTRHALSLRWMHEIETLQDLPGGIFWTPRLLAYTDVFEPQFEFAVELEGPGSPPETHKVFLSVQEPLHENAGPRILNELGLWVQQQTRIRSELDFLQPLPLPAKARWTARFVKAEPRRLSGFDWSHGARYVNKMHSFLHFEVTLSTRDGQSLLYRFALPEPDADDINESAKIRAARNMSVPAQTKSKPDSELRNCVYQKLYDLTYKHWRWTRVFDFTTPRDLGNGVSWSAQHIPDYDEETSQVRYVITVKDRNGNTQELTHCLTRPSNEVPHDKPLPPPRSPEDIARIRAAGGNPDPLRTRWKSEKKGAATKLAKWIRKTVQKLQF